MPEIKIQLTSFLFAFYYACEPEGEFYLLDQELFVVLYYAYSYFIMG